MSSTCTPSNRRESNPPPLPPPTEPLPPLPSLSASSKPPPSSSLSPLLIRSVWPHVAKNVFQFFTDFSSDLIDMVSKVRRPRPDSDRQQELEDMTDQCRALAIVFCAQYAGQARLVHAAASLDHLVCITLQLKSHQWRTSSRPGLIKPLMDVAYTWDLFASAMTAVNANLDGLVDLVAAASDPRDLVYLLQETNRQPCNDLFSLRPREQQPAGYPMLRRMADYYLAQANHAVTIEWWLKLLREGPPGDKGKGREFSRPLPRNGDDFFDAWLVAPYEIGRRTAQRTSASTLFASTSSAPTSTLLASPTLKPKRRAPKPPATAAQQHDAGPSSPSSSRPPVASQQQPRPGVVARAVEDTIARLEGRFDGPITQAQVDVDLHVLAGAGLSPRVQRRVIRAVKRRGRAKGVQL